jgi:hypothetical protein
LAVSVPRPVQNYRKSTGRDQTEEDLSGSLYKPTVFEGLIPRSEYCIEFLSDEKIPVCIEFGEEERFSDEQCQALLYRLHLTLDIVVAESPTKESSGTSIRPRSQTRSSVNLETVHVAHDEASCVGGRIIWNTNFALRECLVMFLKI